MVDKEREEIVAKLQETEDWLYEDGEDETKGVYISKLDELKKVVCLFLTMYCLLLICPIPNIRYLAIVLASTDVYAIGLTV